jgi:hypothetical protein
VSRFRCVDGQRAAGFPVTTACEALWSERLGENMMRIVGRRCGRFRSPTERMTGAVVE